MQKTKPGYKFVKSFFGKEIEIPEEWEMSNLTNLGVKTSSGGTPSRENGSYYTGENIWIKSGDLDNGVLNNSKEKITDDALKNSSAKQFPKNTVLVAMYGATIGKTGILGKNASTNQAICAILPSPIFDTIFLQQFFILKKNILVSFGMGAGQPNISQDLIQKFKFLVPPISEQQKIADILNSTDELIHHYKKIIKITKKLKMGLMQTLLTRGIGHKKFKKVSLSGQIKIEIPCTWEIKKLGELVTNTRLGTNQVGVVGGLGIPLLKMGNLTYGGFNYKKLEKIQPSNVENIEKYILQENDFLFNTRNTDVLVGKCAVWKNDFSQAIFNNNLMKIDFSKSIENSDYVSYFLNSNLGRRSLRRLVDATTSVAAIYYGSLKLLKFPVPTLLEQQKITSILNKIDSKISELESKKSTIESLKKGLMQKLLTGQIRIKI